jgi:AraC-like DNA-binding protein
MPRTTRHESALGQWEMCRAAPHPSLRACVLEYVGWFEHMSNPLCRRELPSQVVPVIINFGAPVRIFHQDDLSRWTDYGSFCAGPWDTYVLVGSAGPSGGVQINFSMLGARLFLGRPLSALTNRVFALEDVLGRFARDLTAELHDAPTWEARFTILDRAIGARVSAARAPSNTVLWTWRRLVTTGGRASIGTIVEEAGCSQRHLIAQFRDEIGLTPKVLGRVLRFGRAVDTLRLGGGARLADVAADCGYYDQAHFSRDFRAFAGVTPTELVRSLMPDQGGFSADR